MPGRGLPDARTLNRAGGNRAQAEDFVGLQPPRAGGFFCLDGE